MSAASTTEFSNQVLTESAVSEPVIERPVLSTHVRFGPPEFIGGKVMYLAKHAETGKYFRMGEKEYFVMHHLDGAHTSDDIRTKYRSHFGRGLSQDSLHNAMVLFQQRGVIHSQNQEDTAKNLVDEKPNAGMGHGPFEWKILSWNPDSWVTTVSARLRWLINGRALTLWALFLLVSEALVLGSVHRIVTEAHGHSTYAWPLRLLALVTLTFVTMMIHEFGHALACKRYGGTVPEMGYLFRYFSFCAYTRIDDILLFAKRLERVYVLLIGPLISLSLIPVALLVWTYSPPASFRHTVALDILIWYNLASVIQLIPFLQFDGYFILAQLLKMPDLRQDSYKFLLQKMLRGKRTERSVQVSEEHAGYLVPIYVGYGVLSVLITSLAVALILAQNGKAIVQSLGPVASSIVLAFLVGGGVWRICAVAIPRLRSTGSK